MHWLVDPGTPKDRLKHAIQQMHRFSRFALNKFLYEDGLELEHDLWIDNDVRMISSDGLSCSIEETVVFPSANMTHFVFPSEARPESFSEISQWWYDSQMVGPDASRNYFHQMVKGWLIVAFEILTPRRMKLWDSSISYHEHRGFLWRKFSDPSENIITAWKAHEEVSARLRFTVFACWKFALSTLQDPIPDDSLLLFAFVPKDILLMIVAFL